MPLFSTHPEGFRLVEGAVPAGEEADALALVPGLALTPYVMHGTPSRRLIAAFGATYGTRLGEAPPMPPAIVRLRDRACAALDLDPAPYTMGLVNVYPPGAGIGWHRDHAQYGEVVGVSLAASGRMQLRPRAGGATLEVTLAPRSAYAIAGGARWDWEHRIVPVKVERVSLTFRTRIR